MELLPIGTIILLKNIDKKIMIYGKNVIRVETNTKYDYLGCLYPEGYIGEEHNIFFNHDYIKKIYK